MNDNTELGSLGLLALGIDPVKSTRADWHRAAALLNKHPTCPLKAGSKRSWTLVTQVPNFFANASSLVKSPAYDLGNKYTLAWQSGFTGIAYDPWMTKRAGPWTTFQKVTLPLILPGVLAAGMLAFAMSIDDFIITSFVAGQTLTFPLWVYGAVKVGIPPQVFVMGTLIFVGGIALALVNVVLQRRASV